MNDDKNFTFKTANDLTKSSLFQFIIIPVIIIANQNKKLLFTIYSILIICMACNLELLLKSMNIQNIIFITKYSFYSDIFKWNINWLIALTIENVNNIGVSAVLTICITLFIKNIYFTYANVSILVFGYAMGTILSLSVSLIIRITVKVGFDCHELLGKK